MELNKRSTLFHLAVTYGILPLLLGISFTAQATPRINNEKHADAPLSWQVEGITALSDAGNVTRLNHYPLPPAPIDQPRINQPHPKPTVVLKNGNDFAPQYPIPPLSPASPQQDISAQSDLTSNEDLFSEQVLFIPEIKSNMTGIRMMGEF